MLDIPDGRVEFGKMRERIIAILTRKKLTAKCLEQLSGIDRERWYALRRGSRRLNEDDIKVIVDALWLVSGKIAPEAGQTSPEYDEAHESLLKPSAG